MDAISIDMDDLQSRASRFPVRLAVATGETAEAAQPWGIASNVSTNGLFVRTNRIQAQGEKLRLWFVDGRQLRSIDAQVVRRGTDGVGVNFDDESFYRWAFDRVTVY
ncbi:PilZ domain-containing protein [Myxococcota bacterium]